MTLRLAACVLALALTGCETSTPALTEAEVQEFVRQYVAASNGFDPAKAMSFIQKDEGVTSAGLGTIHRGWEAIRAATDTSFKEEVRIKLVVDSLAVTPITADAALAVGSMTVSSPQPIQLGRTWLSSAAGAMTLVVKRTPEGLRVIHEHYSLRPA
jgi:ketosteroid isomerase-like protein